MRIHDRHLEGVVFDMDGVLIDSEPIHYQSTVAYLNGEFGLRYNERENEEFLGRTDQYMFSILKERYQLSQSVEELINRRREIYLKLLRGNVALTPGVTHVLTELKGLGLKIGLASSSLQSVIDVVLAEGRIEEYFDAVQSGEKLTTSKPDPEIFLLTAEKMGVKPQACAVVEDTAIGIEGAKRAGMYAIAYDSPYAPEQDFGLADLVVLSFEELNAKFLAVD